MRSRSRVLSALTLVPLALGAAARGPEKPAVDFPGLTFRLVGPFVGGSASRVQGLPGDPFTYDVSTAAGGVWKSTAGGMGISWRPAFS